MRTTLFILTCFLLSQVSPAQIDSLTLDRYDVINEIFKPHSKSKERAIGKRFLQFRALQPMLLDIEFFDNLWGECYNLKLRETFKISDTLSMEERRKMVDQIYDFSTFRFLNNDLIAENISLKDDIENDQISITLPLIINNKAIVYMTNKHNEDQLFILSKVQDDWKIICRKYFYLRLDD